MAYFFEEAQEGPAEEDGDTPLVPVAPEPFFKSGFGEEGPGRPELWLFPQDDFYPFVGEGTASKEPYQILERGKARYHQEPGRGLQLFQEDLLYGSVPKVYGETLLWGPSKAAKRGQKGKIRKRLQRIPHQEFFRKL